MRTVLSILLVLLCSSSAAVAQEEEHWVSAQGEEKYGTNCFLLMPDGRLLIFHSYYVLQARSDYRGWEIAEEHPYMSIERARVNPRGEIIASVSAKGIWRSSDGGKTWENKSGAGTLSYLTITDIYISPEGYIYGAGENLFSDGRPVWRSRDNGESWHRIGSGLSGDAGAIGVGLDGTMYVCGGKGLYRSGDSGETFSPVREWGATSSIYGEDIEVHPSGVVVVGSNGEGGLAWRSNREGKDFKLVDLTSVAAATIDSTGRIYMFGRGEHGLKVFRSLDTGKTWEEYNSGRSGEWVNNVYDMITTPEGYVFTGGMSIHRTTYRRHTAPVFWGRRRLCNVVEYVVVDSSVASVQLVSSQSGNVLLDVLSPPGAARVKIRLRLLNEQKPGYFTLRALNAAGVETLCRDTLQPEYPEPVIRRSGDTLWAGGGYVYQWYRDGELIEGERREYLIPQESGMYSVQVLNAYGCERRSADFAYVSTSVVEKTATSTGLCSVVPNPSDGEVRIGYSVSERMPVHLVVVDALGREVALVVAGEREAGGHSVSWDGRGLISGIYSVRLECGGRVYRRPLVIVK